MNFRIERKRKQGTLVLTAGQRTIHTIGKSRTWCTATVAASPSSVLCCPTDLVDGCRTSDVSTSAKSRWINTHTHKPVSITYYKYINKQTGDGAAFQAAANSSLVPTSFSSATSVI
jgi:hypothetical protein